MEECVDGDYQAFKAKDGAYLREHFFGKYPELLELVRTRPTSSLVNLHRGGHDPAKIYNAYKRAIEHKGSPTVILAKTVKGYGLGAAQARNATHSEKKLTDERPGGVREALQDSDCRQTRPSMRQILSPGADSDRRSSTCRSAAPRSAAHIPQREVPKLDFKAPKLEYFHEWTGGSKGRAVSTTMGFVSILRDLLKDPSRSAS